MKKLLKMLYWFILVFSWEKSFRKNPIIGNYWLNKAGLHVMRLMVAHGLFQFRLWLLSPLLAKTDRQAFKDTGLILKHNFLPEAEFTALKQELTAYKGPIRETLEGDTLTQRVFLTQESLVPLPLFYQKSGTGSPDALLLLKKPFAAVLHRKPEIP